MDSDVKWIKIVTNIFDDDKILLIESMPEADSVIVIWFKLLCLAGKQNNNGVFVINDAIPYTEEMFANVFHRPLNVIHLAMETFIRYGMVEIVNKVYTIPKWEKHQSLDAMEALKKANRERVARHREKQKEMLSSPEDCNVTSNVTSNVTVMEDVMPCNDIDKEIDKDKEEEKKKKVKKEKEPDNSPVIFEIPLNDGTTYGVTSNEIAEYEKLYPDVNVRQEYRNMIGWCNHNPKKTRTGIGRFINRWLANNQNHAPSRNKQQQQYVPLPKVADIDKNPFDV